MKIINEKTHPFQHAFKLVFDLHTPVDITDLLVYGETTLIDSLNELFINRKHFEQLDIDSVEIHDGPTLIVNTIFLSNHNILTSEEIQESIVIESMGILMDCVILDNIEYLGTTFSEWEIDEFDNSSDWIPTSIK
jgi:hypothetical protein